jgi:biopolymer transport protein ExbB/biopolymer transport protein TolQ
MMTHLMNVADSIASVVLYLLIALSVISLAISLERLVYFLQRRVDATALGRELTDRLARRDLEGARALLRGSRAVEAAVMLEALDWVGRGTDSVREVIEGSLREKKKEYERGLLYLGTLGNNAPFIGLFGTVLGIVSAFKELGNAGATGQMGNVMSGISEALIATGVGLVVAIPAVVTFNYFQSRATQVEDNVATLTNYLFAQLKSLGGVPQHAPGNHAQQPQPQPEPAEQTEQAFSSPAV